MAGATAEKEAPAAAPVAAPAKKSGKLMLILGVVVAAIVVNLVVLYMLVPREAAAKPDEAASKEHGGKGGHNDEPTGPVDDTVEVVIGEFNSTNVIASPGLVIHVDFKLSAITTGGQASSLEAQLKTHQARVREKVFRIARSSNLEDLNDPNLGTLKRQIREDINRLLRKSYVTEVIISDMRTIEQ